MTSTPSATAYYDAVSAESSLLNRYRLSEATTDESFASDDFAGTGGALLTADAGGASWAYLQGGHHQVVHRHLGRDRVLQRGPRSGERRRT